MKKKFAFVLMGEHYAPEQHQARFETEKQITGIFTVKSYEQACRKLTKLEQEGFGAVELCGAFGEEKAKELIALTHGKIAIGFVTHLPEQDELFARFFAKG
ncbi:DUF6506 family protein [Faecalispora sporosphaeroides]|uniref:DUF6506 family protein n=1 Tax=Faecalispora sporosphaeroides TaxID=1549 RepID=UPI00035D1EC8|nr:DUF6506 family protein [Faecalispora sporosphaeroides]